MTNQLCGQAPHSAYSGLKLGNEKLRVYGPALLTRVFYRPFLEPEQVLLLGLESL